MSNNPFRDLAAILEQQMSNQAVRAVSGIPSELGTITSSGLKLDSFKHEIRDYLVAEWLLKVEVPAFTIKGTQSGLLDSQGKSVTGQATFTFLPTVLDDVRLELKAGLKPGDRVLTIPVHGGQDIVVIAKVMTNG